MSQLVRESLWAAAVLPADFIDAFCDAGSFNGDFHNWLRGFTPCFADVAVLGMSPSPPLSNAHGPQFATRARLKCA